MWHSDGFSGKTTDRQRGYSMLEVIVLLAPILAVLLAIGTGFAFMERQQAERVDWRMQEELQAILTGIAEDAERAATVDYYTDNLSLGLYNDRGDIVKMSYKRENSSLYRIRGKNKQPMTETGGSGQMMVKAFRCRIEKAASGEDSALLHIRLEAESMKTHRTYACETIAETGSGKAQGEPM